MSGGRPTRYPTARDLEAGRDVYACFDNDVGSCAVDDAVTPKRRVTG